LHNHTQCVVIENCHSSYTNVPQSSVLGCTLFILIINDIDRVYSSNTKLKLFADDLKLYCVIDIANCAVCSSDLQQLINSVLQWANLWQFTVNAGKTFVLTLNNGASSVSGRSFSVNNVSLSLSNLIFDFGITIDRRHLFQNHINNIVSKSMQRCGILFCGFLSHDLSMMRKAFITYIRQICLEPN
jgi:Reverse transcriptase (RNA-dependent DNA polymerase)